MDVIVAYKGRHLIEDISIYDADGGLVTISAGDVVRIKIGRIGADPELDLDSAAASANGSTTTRANPTRLTISQNDLADLTPGTRSIEVSIVDYNEGQIIKHAETGVFSVIGTPNGDVGIS